MLWLLFELATQASSAITIDRDCSSGIRLAGLLAGIGLILGKAVAGNWVSVVRIIDDFVQRGLPAVGLTAIAAVMQRRLRPTSRWPAPSSIEYGWLPAVIYVGIAIGILVWWPQS